MKNRPIDDARLRLAGALDKARLAEAQAIRAGLPDREWPLAWDRPSGSPGQVPGRLAAADFRSP